jgi:Ca2+-binding RTX toxin-like protein
MLLIGVPAMWPSSASAATASAWTSGCTITVTRTMHVVHGTRGADRICVIGRGRHVIYAGGGNDIVWDSAASDQIFGGAGADIIYGGSGNDLVDGGRGADQLCGEGGNDTLKADAGSDSVYGGDGSDTVSGNGGSDSLSGGDGSDTVSGGAGTDLANGDGGNDFVSGGGGDDTVSGGNDADTLTGDAGNDHVFGGAGDDDLSGGAGANTCDGGGGVDHLDLTCDSTPPRLVWLRFSDTRVDTSVGPVQVTITARFTDDLSGFDQASVGVGTIGAVFHQSDRISGDPLDGTYRTTLYLYQYMPQGTWPIALTVRDAVGNHNSLTSSDLRELDQPWQFTQAGPGDDTAPTVSNLVLNSTTLDTSAGPASVTATVHADDDVSGFDSL